MIDFIGHILNKAEYNEDEQTLSLTIDNNKVFLLKVEGDCCSTGKFLGVNIPWKMETSSKIISQDERSTAFRDGEYQVYETVLGLENGDKVTINYDNTSNGYYGSSLEAYYDGKPICYFPEKEKSK